jgi:hypothetical protein
MIRRSSGYFFGITLLAAVTFSANAESIEKSITAFTACDAGFFKAVAADAAAWRVHTGISGTDQLAWIKTNDRNATGGNVSEIQSKPLVAGLPITHYLDEASNLGSLGLYYYWGFKVAGTLDSVAEQLKPFVLNNARLRKDEGTYVRSELKFSGKPWLPVPTQGGRAPRPFTVERVLLIEADTTLPNTVKVLCSLQGDITAEILQELRPDIDPKDYPMRLDPQLFEKIQPRDQVLQAVRTAAAANPIWKPNFKRLTYSYATNSGDVPVELVNSGDGLVTVSENYTFFKVTRLMSGGFAQLKSRMNTNGLVYVTDQLTLEVPAKFEKGAILSFNQTSKTEPVDMDRKPSSTALSCVVGESFEASKIFASLQGLAVGLVCTRDNKEKTGKALIENLGVVVDYTPATGLFGSSTPRYTRFNIEQ